MVCTLKGDRGVRYLVVPVARDAAGVLGHLHPAARHRHGRFDTKRHHLADEVDVARVHPASEIKHRREAAHGFNERRDEAGEPVSLEKRLQGCDLLDGSHAEVDAHAVEAGLGHHGKAFLDWPLGDARAALLHGPEGLEDLQPMGAHATASMRSPSRSSVAAISTWAPIYPAPGSTSPRRVWISWLSAGKAKKGMPGKVW